MLISELAKIDIQIDLNFVVSNFLGRSYPVVIEQIRKDFGVEMSAAFEVDYRERLLAEFERSLVIMPGVQDVLQHLNVQSCVATGSSPDRVKRSLEIVGLDGFFGDRVFTTSQVRHGKPAPDIFLHVAKRMGADPMDCLIIEDSLNGIRAANAAGMKVWRFIGGSHLINLDFDSPLDARAELAFASFEEFYDLAPQLRIKDRPGAYEQ